MIGLEALQGTTRRSRGEDAWILRARWYEFLELRYDEACVAVDIIAYGEKRNTSIANSEE